MEMGISEQLSLLEATPEGTIEDCQKELFRSMKKEKHRSTGVVYHRDNEEAVRCTAAVASSWVKAINPRINKQEWHGGQMVVMLRSPTHDADIFFEEMVKNLNGFGNVLHRKRDPIVLPHWEPRKIMNPINIRVIGTRSSAGVTLGYTIHAAFLCGLGETCRYWSDIWNHLNGGFPPSHHVAWAFGSRPKVWDQKPKPALASPVGHIWGFLKVAGERGTFRCRLSPP